MKSRGKFNVVLCLIMLFYLLGMLGENVSSILASEDASDLVIDFEDGTTGGWQRGWGEGFDGETELMVSNDLVTADDRKSLRVNTAFSGTDWEEAAIRTTSSITVSYADAILEGYGIEKRGPVKEDEDTLYDGEGYISYFFAEDADAQEPVGSATFTIDVEEAGLYKLSLGYYIPEGYGGKAIGLQVNGTGAGELMLDAPAAGIVRAEKMVSKVLLNAGSNTVKIMRGWGYYGIEHIKVEPAVPPGSGNKLEAEDGIMTGGVSIGTSETGYSGEGYAIFQQFGSLVLTYHAPSEGMYDVTIGYSSPNGEKKTSIIVNGQNTEITFAETTDFIEVSAGKALMSEGSNRIEILPNWGWYNIDYVKLTAAAATDGHDVTGSLINPEATNEAKALMSYLASQYGSKIISGQQTLEDVEWIKQQTGKYPAIFSTDLIDYSPSRVENGATSTEVEKMIDWHNRGGIVALCWHWNAPKGIGGNEPGNEWWRGFYTEHSTFDVEYALKNPDSEDYQLLIRDIDAIAVQLTRLHDAGVPVLWRPLHEAEGGWFWWGAKGPEPAKQLWNLMYDRLTNYHDLNNLIWVWNSEKAEWYPGDDAVDIASVDFYNPAGDYNPSIARYEGLVSLVNNKKVVALAENGPIPDPDLLQAYGADWSFFSTWTGTFIRDGKTNTAEHLNKVYHHDYVITLDELPADLYPASSPPLPGNNYNSGSKDQGDPNNDSGPKRFEADGIALMDALSKLVDQPIEKQVYVITVNGSDSVEVILPAYALAQAAGSTPNATILIKSDAASYSLPVNLIDIDSMAERLRAKASDIRISVKMEKVNVQEAEEILKKIENFGAQRVGDFFDFRITVESTTDSIEWSDFGSTFISRTISIPQSPGGNMTAVMLDPVTGELRFVPGLIEEAAGKTIVTIKRSGNSIYGIVKLERTFGDLDGHLAKDDIEMLASKLVVHGINDERFAPNRAITRAEFATLVVRALGLSPQPAKALFSDVDPLSWYAGTAGAASEAGIMIGHGDGTFKPNESITREQMAVIIARAITFTGQRLAMGTDANLERFSDHSSVSVWAKDSVNAVLAAGLMQGIEEDRYAPEAKADRAQAAVLIKELLVYMKFLNI